MNDFSTTLMSLESELLAVLQRSPEGSYTLSELREALASHPELDDLRASLWDLYYRSMARPFTGEHSEQRWRLAERQTTNLR